MLSHALSRGVHARPAFVDRRRRTRAASVRSQISAHSGDRKNAPIEQIRLRSQVLASNKPAYFFMRSASRNRGPSRECSRAPAVSQTRSQQHQIISVRNELQATPCCKIAVTRNWHCYVIRSRAVDARPNLRVQAVSRRKVKFEQRNGCVK